MEHLTNWFQTSWSAFLSANPFATFISAALGAFAGATATSWREKKRSVVAELNSVNAARALCFSICGAFINQKKQHILDLKNTYDNTRSEFTAAQEAAAARPNQRVVIALKPNFANLTPVRVPLETLERQVLDKTSVTGRALVGAAQLITVIDCFEKAIHYRNELINDIRNNQRSTEELARLYYGLSGPTGVDERFKNNVEALSLYVDDCIFFSKLLAHDLLIYGRKLRRQHAWRFWQLPYVDREDWTEAQQAGLIPPDEQYKDWIKGFKPAPSKLRRFVQWVSGDEDA
jgi:hypothetical protein